MILKSKSRYKKPVAVISFLILLMCFKSSNPWSDLPVGNEFFWWIMQSIFIILLLKFKSAYTSPKIEQDYLFIKLYLCWNLVCIVRGTLVADNYWEWKNLLATSFFLLLPLLVYVTNSFLSLQIIVKTWFRYALILFVAFLPFLYGDAIGKFLMPFSFLLLFFPVLNSKWKIITVLVTLFIVTFDITARSNVLKFAIPLLIGLLLYVKNILSNRILNVGRIVLLFLPFILLFLAVTNIFNVFKMDQYLGEYETKSNVRAEGGTGEESLTADTRTFLYVEVIESALRHEYVLFGRTPARGNDSATFGEYNKLTLNTGKLERFSNEVSILNIFTWLGSVGVLLYFLIFIKATYLAINGSNNIFIKLIGINVAFRWTYGWIEDFSTFDLSNIFLWIMIGMCFSEPFRKMSDKQMIWWIKGIFEKEKTARRKTHNTMLQQTLMK